MSVSTTTTTAIAGQRGSAPARYPHGSDHGFCTVCGGVWPCHSAPSDPPAPATPVPRLPTLAPPAP
jgi:hypothetical protein